MALLTRSSAAPYVVQDARASVLLQVLGIVGFAALAALGAQVRVYLWEVPITLQTMAVYGAGLFLGGRNGMLAMLLYLAAGLVVPVFASESYGWAYLTASASAGYLLAYPLVAALVGALAVRWTTLAGSALAMVLGMVVLFTSGVVWLHEAAAHVTWWESIYKGAALFVVWDLLKIGVVTAGYDGLRRLLQKA